MTGEKVYHAEMDMFKSDDPGFVDAHLEIDVTHMTDMEMLMFEGVVNEALEKLRQMKLQALGSVTSIPSATTASTMMQAQKR